MHDAEQFRCPTPPEPGPEEALEHPADVESDIEPLLTGADPQPEAGLTGAAALLEGLDTGLAFLAAGGLIRWCNRSFEGHHPGGPWTGRHALDLHDADDPVYEQDAAIRLETDIDAEYRFQREVAGRLIRYCLRRADTDAVGYVLETAAAGPGSVGLRPGPFPEVLVAADGRMLALNTAFAEMVGEPAGSLIGRSLSEVLTVADWARVAGLLSQAVGNTAQAVEVQLVRSDGEASWAELVLLAATAADAGSGEDPATSGNVLVQARDITTRKRDALLLQEVFEAAPLPYALVDPHGVVMSVNPAWRQRVGPLNGPGRPLADAVAEDSRQQLADLFARSRSGSAPGTGEGSPDRSPTPERDGFELVTLLELAQGEPALARLAATALHDLQGRVERLLVSLDDLTAHALEVEAARRASVQIRATLDELDVAVVSHDAEGRAQELNLGAVRLFGDSAAELIGTGPLPPRWQALDQTRNPMADGDHPLSRVLATGGPLSAAGVVWLPSEPAGPAGSADTDAAADVSLPTLGRRYLIRARAVTQLRPARRVGAVVVYAAIDEESLGVVAPGEDPTGP